MNNPKNPKWFNRDRFVLSAGHGCMLQYALLHLTGYDSVTIEDIEDTQGRLMVAIVDSEQAFAGEGEPVMSLILPAREGSVTFTSNALAPGEYAMRVMHDLNGNGEMDANMVGIPKEPWGFSNSATGSFGPPKWKKAKFTIDGDTQQTIELVH